jgi:hypothetical protein
MRDHSNARAADDSTLKSSASGADAGSGSASFEPGVGKKCFASSFCCAVDSYATAHVNCTVSLGSRSKMNLECNEADDNACDEETEGDEKPDDAPHFAEPLASQGYGVRGRIP